MLQKPAVLEESILSASIAYRRLHLLPVMTEQL
jgi:hypothetical protein